MASNRVTSRRTDEQLDVMLDEVSHWTVNGRRGKVICSAASLREAIDAASRCGAGVGVTAVCRLPGDDIIVFVEQMTRLRRTIALREMAYPGEA